MSPRVSRRAFIGGGGALAAGAVATVLAASRDGRSRAPAGPPPGTSPTAAPTLATTPVSRPRQGGSAAIVSPASLNFDTFDAQLSGSPAVVEILGRTHSRLLNWNGRGDRTLIGDLAARWEQPDAQTIVFHLDPAARWHDKPPLNGRPLTADDVVVHFHRTLALAQEGNAPLAQRYHDYSSVASVDSPAAGQVRFRLGRADPFFLGTLAGEYAVVQAPEAVAAFAGLWSRLDSDHVVGTGPWTFDWADDGLTFAAARTGHRSPYLDELRLSEPHNVADRFLAGHLDEAIVRDRREAAVVRQESSPELFDPRGDINDALQLSGSGRTYEFRRYEHEIVMSSFFVGAPPWNNLQLVSALSNALSRAALVERLFAGRAEVSGAIPPALTPRDAGQSPDGLQSDHGDDPEGRLNARRLWVAAGGPGLGPVTIDFPSIFDPLYSASSIVVGLLNEAIGPQFRAAVETYTTISRRVLDGYYGSGRAAFWFGWGPPLPGPDRERYFQETYGPGSPGQRASGGPGTTRDALGSLANASYSGIVPWVQQYAEVFRRPGHVAAQPTPFWPQHLDYVRSNA